MSKHDFNTYYWCHKCREGFLECEVESKVVQEAHNFGHGDAVPEERESICPECGETLLEGYMCSVCQQIVEHTHQYTMYDADRACEECLPASLISVAMRNIKFSLACQLSTILRITFDDAKAKAVLAINSYDFTEIGE